jgi:excisionase family DNA binding protein
VKELLSPRQVARAIGVSEASLKRWCDQGLLPATRTAGGHRRLTPAGVLEFLRQTGRELVRPEVLGLPTATGRTDRAIHRVVPPMVAALLAGDEGSVRRLLFNLFLGGHSLVDIGDRVLAVAFDEIGRKWEADEIEIYCERRACEVCVRVLQDFRSALPPPPAGAPVAIGGTPAGDVYQLPTLLVELVLRQAGWQAQSYGVGLPLDTLSAALERVRPQLFWLSASWIPDRDEFLAAYARLQATAAGAGVPVVVGGRALTEDIRRAMRYAAFGDTLGHLTTFVDSLGPRPARPESSP